MRRRTTHATLLMIVTLIALTGLTSHLRARTALAPDNVDVSATDRLKSLSWLEGAWHGKVGNSNYEAVYSSTGGGSIVSASKQSQGDRTQMFDFETFQVKGDDVFMTPYPGGNKSVSFKLVDHDPKKHSAKFSNPEHDFPKALHYEMKGGDRLVISLFSDSNTAAMTFELKRKKK